MGLLGEQSLALYEALNDSWGMARILTELCFFTRNFGPIGTAEQRQQQLNQAEQLAQRGLALCRKTGDQAGLVDMLTQYGLTLYYLGRVEEAYTVFEECVGLAAGLGVQGRLAYANIFLGFSHVQLGRNGPGRSHIETGVKLARDISYHHHLGVGLYALSIVAIVEGDYEEAQQLLQESLEILQSIGNFHEQGWARGPVGLRRAGSRQRKRSPAASG